MKSAGSGGWCGLLVLMVMAGSAAAAQGEQRIALAWLNGQSGEYVYDAYGDYYGPPGYKVSELQWQLDNVLMLGLGGSYRPNERLRLNIDFWTSLGDGDGVMDDYDWLIDGMEWTHWSHHDNTTVTEASKLDLNADFTLHSDNAKGYTINAAVGYRQDRFGWESVGGYGIYSDVDFSTAPPTLVNFRNYPVTFPDIPVITYEQTYRTPYLGLGVSAVRSVGGRELSLEASLRFSRWVSAEDEDVHILRDMRFESSGSGGQWLEYELKLDYPLKERLTLSLAYSSQEYDEIRGSMVVTDLITGVAGIVPGDSSGLDHQSRQLSLGLNYAF